MQLATDPLTGKMVALKRVKPHSDAITKKEGFSLVALREIRLLQMLNDKNIVKLLGVVTDHQSSRKQGTLGEVFLCLEYAMSDLNGLKALPDFKLTPAHVQCYMYQLLRGVYVMHRHGILHRDIKRESRVCGRDLQSKQQQQREWPILVASCQHRARITVFGTPPRNGTALSPIPTSLSSDAPFPRPP